MASIASALFGESFLLARRCVEMTAGVLSSTSDLDSSRAKLSAGTPSHEHNITKVPVDENGVVGDVRVVVRPILPDAGCLWCGGAISPTQLGREALRPEERECQRYVDDHNVHEPSVISLNALGASQAVNVLLFMFTGLHEPNPRLTGRFQWARRREWEKLRNKPEPSCRHCGRGLKSVYAQGDGRNLPTRRREQNLPMNQNL